MPRITAATVGRSSTQRAAIVAIDESWRLLRFNLLPIPFGVRVRVRIGRPVPRSEGEDRRALLEAARGEIAQALESWRGAPPAAPENPAKFGR